MKPTFIPIPTDKGYAVVVTAGLESFHSVDEIIGSNEMLISIRQSAVEFHKINPDIGMTMSGFATDNFDMWFDSERSFMLFRLFLDVDHA